MARVSQQRIAQELGVSQSLVSIVLNGRREGISEETYNRIWQCARELGYTPKGMKMNLLNEGRVGLHSVGYLLRAPLSLATTSNFFSHVTQGLHDFLEEHQINTVFLGSEKEVPKDSLPRLAWKIEYLRGIVILGEVQPAFLAEVRKLGKPVVYVSARAPGLCHSVNSNEVQAAEMLAEHLIGLGHSSFAVLGSVSPRSRNLERITALKAALGIRGVDLPDEAIHLSDGGDPIHGFRLAQKIHENRASQPMPTALVAMNGLQARGAINYFGQNGFKVGRDISIAAFDMTRVCTQDHPSITSAAAVPEDLGRHAGKLLIERSEDEPLADVVLPARFEARESTGPVSQAERRLA